MISQPEKWKKYEVLFKYALASEEEITAQIKRYSKHSKMELFKDIASDMERNTFEVTYVIKLVPTVLRPKLKNYTVQNREQLRAIQKTIDSIMDYDELWWCKTHLSSGSGIHGRLFINSGNTTNVAQYIEQVWADTARKIEKIGDGIPYLTAQRLWWGRKYHIQNCDISQIDSAMAKWQFREVTRQIEERKLGIEQFAQDAVQINVDSLCIEYKLIDGILHIVDWDSPEDETLLRGLL